MTKGSTRKRGKRGQDDEKAPKPEPPDVVKAMALKRCKMYHEPMLPGILRLDPEMVPEQWRIAGRFFTTYAHLAAATDDVAMLEKLGTFSPASDGKSLCFF